MRSNSRTTLWLSLPPGKEFQPTKTILSFLFEKSKNMISDCGSNYVLLDDDGDANAWGEASKYQAETKQ